MRWSLPLENWLAKMLPRQRSILLRNLRETKEMFLHVKNIHFVGVGGIGMSGIAEVLCDLGFSVSGSDLKKSKSTDRLEKMGARIFEGHDEPNVGNAQVVVYSSAVKEDN